MAAKLVAEDGNLKGLVLSFEKGEEWVIGRDPESCQLLVEDPMVSRKHLLCRRTADGITVENLSHTNPILLNGTEISDNSKLLKNGDALQIGSGIFRFLLEAQIFNEEDTAEEEKAETDAKMHDSLYQENADEEDKNVLAAIDFDLTETGRWLLKVVGGPNSGAEFFMHAGHNYTIGTDPTSCDVVFHDTSVSRKHARITIPDEKDITITIEDLGSRNGTLVEGQIVQDKQKLPNNTVVTTGTTSFIVFDREGEMHTIISPLLPSIVKSLQKEEDKEKEEAEKKQAALHEAEKEVIKTQRAHTTLGAFILIGIMSGLFIIIGIGTASLFRSTPVVSLIPLDVVQQLKNTFANFPSVRYSYNQGTGQLLLVGHVLTANDKNQLIYNLQGLHFIKNIDDNGIIIDEYVWRETNQILGRNPRWKGITVSSPKAGTFILSGYLKSRKEGEELSDYMAFNFPYLDLLETHVVVEENVISTIETALQNTGIGNVQVTMENGEIALKGTIPNAHTNDFMALIKNIQQIPGVRQVKNFVAQAEPEKAMIDLTGKYKVSGFSRIGDSVSVIINGRILTKGDTIDAMTITDISPSTIFLKKDRVYYRIEYQ